MTSRASTKRAVVPSRRGPRDSRPSSAGLNPPLPADWEDGTAVHDADEHVIQLGDADDWPERWGAARLGIP